MKRFLFIIALLAGCTTQPPAAPPVIQAPKPQIMVPEDPYTDLPENVQRAIRTGQTPMLRNGITTEWAYDPNKEYPLYCQTLKATTIRLAPDEVTDKDMIVVGDATRWTVRVGVHTVSVEPVADSSSPNMKTNLIIVTNLREYHLAVALRPRGQSVIGWYYPATVKAQAAAREVALKQEAQQ